MKAAAMKNYMIFWPTDLVKKMTQIGNRIALSLGLSLPLLQ